MKIELWEDIVCSWCGIANERVNEALRRFGREDEVEFVHRSFRLIDDLPEGESVNFTEFMMAQRGITIEQVEQMAAPLQTLAVEVGLPEYHVTDNNIGNTTLTHEFLAWASDQGKQNEAWDLLFREHFVKQTPIWSIDDLVPFAQNLGLDPESARQALEARTYKNQVENDHNEALALGSRGVPFLVIDRKYGISGAQKVELILDALENAWSEKEAANA